MSSNRDISPDQLGRVAALVADASGSGGIPQALATFMQGVAALTGADRAALSLEQEGRLVTCYADQGSGHLLASEVLVEGSVEGACYRSGAPVLSDDLARDRRFEALGPAADERSLIAIPLHLEGPPIGLVRLSSIETARFGGKELTVARLVVAALRKLLLQGLRAEREALGFRDRDFATAGVWALRDRRKVQLQRSGQSETAVTLVRYDIRGYLTSEIVQYISTAVRSGDHVFQDDAGTFTLILTGTVAADAELVARRVKAEIERLAEVGGDPIEVAWKVTELGHDAPERRIA